MYEFIIYYILNVVFWDFFFFGFFVKFSQNLVFWE